MKLESISIRDFRGIERLDLDFRDELGLIRDVIPIVGPNTSGKTTILDAISLCLMPLAGVFSIRPGLRFRPSSIVRSGAVQASVTATVWFSDDEIEATREVLSLVNAFTTMPVLSDGRVTIRWTYPAPSAPDPGGAYSWEPSDGSIMSQRRLTVSRYHHVPEVGPRLYRRIGSIFLFDQQRNALWSHIPGPEMTQLGQSLDPEGPVGGSFSNGRAALGFGDTRIIDQSGSALTKDPRLLLTSLAMRASVAQDPKATEQEDFAQLKKLYEHVCRPHTMGELFNTDDGLDIEFQGPQGRYSYDGLSSGQQMILLMLLQFATRRIHRSIVLIDELELHLHPLWQDRLYLALPRLGDDNQYFFTTHSTHIRDTLSDGFCYMTGKLSEPAVMR